MAPAVLFYVRLPDTPNPVLFLSIPADKFSLYSTKPLKWLRYCGYAITGVKADLYLWSAADEYLGVNLESNTIKPGQCYVYSLNQQPAFFDYQLRNAASYQVDSPDTAKAALQNDLFATYVGCPFTGYLESLCAVSHLVPRSKGNNYMQALYRLRGGESVPANINDKSNMLPLYDPIHRALDRIQVDAFLKTPNFALETSELHAMNKPADYDGYAVTVHCFSHDPRVIEGSYHGFASDLKVGSGLSPNGAFSAADGNDETSTHRPPDFIF